MVKEIQFTLPEHRNQAKALGYACGLATGIASPTYPDLPERTPVQALGPIATNDPEGFQKAFAEGHDPGFQFGSQASRELAEVLASLPIEFWWPTEMYFAGHQIMQEPVTPGEDERIIQAVDAFCHIYRRHLL